MCQIWCQISVRIFCVLPGTENLQCIWTNKELDLKWPKLKNASENSYKKCKKFINSKLPNWPNPSSVLYTEPTVGIYYKDFVIHPINMGRENSKYGNEEMLMFLF